MVFLCHTIDNTRIIYGHTPRRSSHVLNHRLGCYWVYYLWPKLELKRIDQNLWYKITINTRYNNTKTTHFTLKTNLLSLICVCTCALFREIPSNASRLGEQDSTRGSKKKVDVLDRILQLCEEIVSVRVIWCNEHYVVV